MGMIYIVVYGKKPCRELCLNSQLYCSCVLMYLIPYKAVAKPPFLNMQPLNLLLIVTTVIIILLNCSQLMSAWKSVVSYIALYTHLASQLFEKGCSSYSYCYSQLRIQLSASYSSRMPIYIAIKSNSMQLIATYSYMYVYIASHNLNCIQLCVCT